MTPTKPPGVNPGKLKQIQQQQALQNERKVYGILIKSIPIESRLIGHNRIIKAAEAWIKSRQEMNIEMQKKLNELAEKVSAANQEIFKIASEIFPLFKNNHKKYDHDTRTLKIFSNLQKKDN